MKWLVVYQPETKDYEEFFIGIYQIEESSNIKEIIDQISDDFSIDYEYYGAVPDKWTLDYFFIPEEIAKKIKGKQFIGNLVEGNLDYGVCQHSVELTILRILKEFSLKIKEN